MYAQFGRAFGQNFLGQAPAWYKYTIVVFLLINPLVAWTLGEATAGWLLLAEFIFTLAMALKCYPLQPGGLLAIEALLIGLTSPDTVLHKVEGNLEVLLLLIFMVAGIFFLKDLLLYTFTRILLGVKSKIRLSLLFALAAAHRVLGDPRARPLALQTLAAINALMAAPHGGWQEALPARLPRRQNPHMHLLEAMLAWQATAPDPAFEAAARESLRLSRIHFQVDGALREFFTETWVLDPATGHIVEPGHMEEWAWLLTQAERLGLDTADAAPVLHRRAWDQGRRDGFLIREMDDRGRPVDARWPWWAHTAAPPAPHQSSARFRQTLCPKSAPTGHAAHQTDHRFQPPRGRSHGLRHRRSHPAG